MEFQVSDTKALGAFYLETLQKLDISTKLNMVALDNFIARHGFNHASVAIVGSNPSVASPDNTPFHAGTKSRQTIDQWFSNADFNYRLEFFNIVNYKKINNKKLTQSEINEHLPKISNRFNRIAHTKHIVTVGNEAHIALKAAEAPHFKMPHPSGLNRFWNDKEAGEAKIKEMLEWLKTSHCQMVKKYRDL